MYHIKKDKRSIQSGRWIYDALSELMQQKDFSEITVTEVVEKAKLGRATFYRNFDSLEDVLRMKSDEAFTGLYVYLLEYYKNNAKKEKTLLPIFLRPFLRYWYLDSSIIELLISANRLDIINESFISMFKLFLPIIDKTHSIIWGHMDYFIAIRSGSSINILIQWIKNNKDMAPDDLVDLIINQMKESFNLNLL